MYKTMVLGRQADLAALKYQRQGRLWETIYLTQGKKHLKVGVAAVALEPQDWVSPYYRDAGIFFTVEFLCTNFIFTGMANEKGSQLDPKLYFTS
ncbi:thiamine pyrophosphate-dependent enzyme [Areca yellow leaf disease phytoplasma]|uniref:thiamine pyrophosphate-dependent enzyme n=1 Tax=Areca yellow leaf disease phytoplasma TaxID=927614 RepID=UPI0035B53B61